MMERSENAILGILVTLDILGNFLYWGGMWMKNMASMMKQAQKLQEQTMELAEETLNEALETVPPDKIEVCKEVLQIVYDNLK